MKRTITLEINGVDRNVTVEARKTLADTLREDCGLTGTHLGCEHGVCGACTVLLDGSPVRSCLMFAVQCVGREVTTIEALGRDGSLHPIQQAFVDNRALQCGFCTPGFIMLLQGALNDRPNMSDEELVELLASNLCRCTGYHSILAAAQRARAELAGMHQSSAPPSS
jgi:carbon-monoxide dehydrogenase small subunit